MRNCEAQATVVALSWLNGWIKAILALAGVVAGITLNPVIGVPMDGGPLKGMDALLSTVQMPGGVPVATVAIGKAGAKNAGYLAAQILSVADDDLAVRVRADRAANAANVIATDAKLQEELKAG